MPFRFRTIVREATTALAVLALYLLVLLTPLHQASGLQRDLDSIGYASLDTWSICVPFTQGDKQAPADVAKCPMTGIGKSDIILTQPRSIHLEAPLFAQAILYPPAPSLIAALDTVEPGQARAPPVAV